MPLILDGLGGRGATYVDQEERESDAAARSRTLAAAAGSRSPATLAALTTLTLLLELAAACAARIDLPKTRYPSFSEVEEQCEDEYEQLLSALHEDEIFEPVNLDAQQDLADRLKDALAEDDAALVDELVDNHVRHLWLQQEAAYYVGLAIGLRAHGSRGGRPVS